jgi:hypothetical protein
VNQSYSENVSKCRLTLKRAPAPEQNLVIALEKWRALFFRLGLIGECQTEKIGYGNLSSRLLKKNFIITGNQTGHLANLQSHHYTRVIECDLKKGFITAEGPLPPGKEAMGHYCIYDLNPQVNFIFEVRHQHLRSLLAQQENLSLKENILFGTLQMSWATNELIAGKDSGLFIFEGHPEVIISYGATAEETGKNLLELYRKIAIRQ